MIGINVISIAQSVNLSTGHLDNILVLQLPDGSEVNAIVPEAVVDKVYALVNGGHLQAQKPAPAPLQPSSVPPQPVVPQPVVPAATAPRPSGGVQQLDWLQLPEEQLPPYYKSALRFLNVSPQLTVSAITKLVAQIDEKFGDHEWAQVLERYPNGPYEEAVTPQQPPPQPPQPISTAGLRPPTAAQPLPQPPIGAVQWSDGSPIMPGAASRGRVHVPVNEAGFPISANTVDPGEVVAGGDEGDEDGVAQF